MHHKLTRRDFLLGAGTAAAGLALGACVPPATPTTAPAAEATAVPVGGKLEWVNHLSAYPPSQPVWDAMKQGFEEKYPGWELVDYSMDPNEMTQQVVMMATSDDVPDMVMSDYVQNATWAYAGALEPLDDYFSQEVREDYVGWEVSVVKGKWYGLTMNGGTLIPIWNRVVLEMAGRDPDKAPSNIEEFEETLAAIAELGTDEEGNKIWPFLTDVYQHYVVCLRFLPFVWGNGGDLWDEQDNWTVNTQENIDTLTWFAGLAEREWIPVGTKTQDNRQIVAKDLAGGYIDGPWAKGLWRDLSGIGDEFYSHTLPSTYPDGKAGISPSIVWGNTIVMMKGSKNKEMAKNFMEYITSTPEILKTYNKEMGHLSCRKSHLRDDPYWEGDWWNAGFKEALLSARGLHWGIPKFQAGLEEVGRAVQAACQGKDPKAALDDATVRISEMQE